MKDFLVDMIGPENHVSKNSLFHLTTTFKNQNMSLEIPSSFLFLKKQFVLRKLERKVHTSLMKASLIDTTQGRPQENRCIWSHLWHGWHGSMVGRVNDIKSFITCNLVQSEQLSGSIKSANSCSVQCTHLKTI